MSSKHGKRLRRLEAQQAAQAGALEAMEAARREELERAARGRARARKRAEEAERAAVIWRAVAIGAITAAIAVELITAAMVWPRAETAKVPTKADPSGEPVICRPIPGDEGRPEYHREAQVLPWAESLGTCTVTHYDCCAACCGKADGITARGVPAVPYISVAVDPAVIPLGSTVLVDYGDGEIHCYRADDTGAAVRGNHIDLCVAGHDEALALGVRTAAVYWMEEVAETCT